MKHRKVFLSGLVSLLYILIFALSVPAEAASPVEFELHGLHNLAYEQTVLPEDSGGAALSSSAYLSNFSSGSFNFYNQLNSMQKAIYNNLKTLTPTSDSITFSFQYTDGTPSQSSLFRIMQGTLDALLCDNPEIFWIDIEKCDVHFSCSSGSNPTVTVKFQQALEDGFSVSASELIDDVNAAAASMPATGSTRYQKLKSLHDELARHVSYDNDAVAYYEQNGTVAGSYVQAFDIYGALARGKAVCEGYAEAFKYLCDRAGIPCVVVGGNAYTSRYSTGESHMWNAVQMEDGKWYNVDVTWDDQDSGTLYDFFLVGSDSLAPAFTSLPFDESHQASGDFSNTGAKIFTYPAISPSAYSPNGSPTTTTTGSGTTVTIPKPVPSISAATVIQTTAPTSPKGFPKTTAAAKTQAAAAGQSETTGQGQTSDVSNTTTETIAQSEAAERDEASDVLTDENAVALESPDPQSKIGTVLIIAGGIFVVAAAGVIVVLILKRKN